MMRTQEERIEALHRRARELEKQRCGRQMAGLGGISVFLAALLTFVVQMTDQKPQSFREDQFAGSSLLSESAGGYVLAAVIAFFAGVVITAVCIRMRQRKSEKTQREQKER